MEEAAEEQSQSPEEKVVAWRKDEFERLGYKDEGLALALAHSSVDLGEVRELIRRGCTPALALRIVW